MRIEPPPSEPRLSAAMPSAAAMPAPPLLPPQVFVASHGLRLIPVSGLSPTPFQLNSQQVVLATNTAPCSRSRAAAGQSSAAGASEVVREPRRVGQPATGHWSLIAVG